MRNIPATASPQTILSLALPALGALAAGPLYLLVDTAIVGHLGRTPLAVVLTANAGSAALSAVLVYGAHLGIRGSAIANALAQSASAVIFAAALARRGAHLRPSPRRMAVQLAAARDLGTRTLAFLVSFSVATAVAAHIGPVTVAAHQIAIQLWSFLALSLDALAIAAQALVGSAVGAGDVAAAKELVRRLVRWGLVTGTAVSVVLLAGTTLIPRLFTSDPAVLAPVRSAWWYLALIQPAA